MTLKELLARARILRVSVNTWPLKRRVLLFVSLLAACALLGYSIWITPLQQANKFSAQRLAQQSAQLKKVRSDLDVAIKASAANQDVVELAANDLSLNKMNQLFEQARPQAATPLAYTLTELLRRREGLSLLRLSAVLPAAINAAAPAVAKSGELTRQGLELSIAGSYPELALYVQTLETTLPDLRWGKLTLKSSGQISELSLQLFVLGVTP
jgi:MSHA biogenesis protein MshJ